MFLACVIKSWQFFAVMKISSQSFVCVIHETPRGALFVLNILQLQQRIELYFRCQATVLSETRHRSRVTNKDDVIKKGSENYRV